VNLDISRVALALALAASIAASLLLYAHQAATVSSLSSELAEKSLRVDQQQQTIDENVRLLDSQQKELDNKAAQVEALRGEIQDLVHKTESQESLIAQRSERIYQLEADISQLQMQATTLEQEVGLLQSEIQAKDEDLAELILENAAGRRTHVAYFGLGVDDKGNGVVFPMELEIIGSGAGRISVDVSNVDYQAGFQDAVRTAITAAAAHTGEPVFNKDIILRLVNDGKEVIRVDGMSAGAAIAVMAIAGLTERQLDDSVLVTGTIQPNGIIGKVGGITAKAEAAIDFGVDKLLVPRGQEFSDNRIEIEGVADIAELAGHIITG
jgi:predicted S18 family serine protease